MLNSVLVHVYVMPMGLVLQTGLLNPETRGLHWLLTLANTYLLSKIPDGEFKTINSNSGKQY